MPTQEGRGRGREIKAAIEEVWTPPSYYYHLRPGGHVAAVREHFASPWVASVDLQRFFDQISRSRVARCLKKIGFGNDVAWEMACDSVVDKRPPQREFSVPFGFIQSPIIASLVLSNSILGRLIDKFRTNGVAITVYVDDISISEANEGALRDIVAQLDDAARLSGFKFNPQKIQKPARTATSFNIEFGSGKMRIVEDRLSQFEISLRMANEPKIEGILAYVAPVSNDDLDRLANFV